MESNTIRINNVSILDCSEGQAIIHVEINGTEHLRLRTFDVKDRTKVLDAGFGISQKDYNQIYVDKRGKLKLI